MTGTPSLKIALGETLDVTVCEAVHAQLRDALRTANAVVLDVSDAADVDVTFLQILVAAQKSAGRAGKTIAFAQPPSGSLAVALTRCGFRTPPQATALAEILSS